MIKNKEFVLVPCVSQANGKIFLNAIRKDCIQEIYVSLRINATEDIYNVIIHLKGVNKVVVAHLDLDGARPGEELECAMTLLGLDFHHFGEI